MEYLVGMYELDRRVCFHAQNSNGVLNFQYYGMSLLPNAHMKRTDCFILSDKINSMGSYVCWRVKGKAGKCREYWLTREIEVWVKKKKE
eukprot:g35367.t1